MALIVPPLPAPSRPSKTMHTLSPACLTHSCSRTSSICSPFRIFVYSLFDSSSECASPASPLPFLTARLRALFCFTDLSCFLAFLLFAMLFRSWSLRIRHLPWNDRRPPFARIVAPHLPRAHPRGRPEIGLNDLAVLLDGERHDARAAILRRIRDHGEAADRAAVHDVVEGASGRVLALTLEHPIVVAVIRRRAAVLFLIAFA